MNRINKRARQKMNRNIVKNRYIAKRSQSFFLNKKHDLLRSCSENKSLLIRGLLTKSENSGAMKTVLNWFNALPSWCRANQYERISFIKKIVFLLLTLSSFFFIFSIIGINNAFSFSFKQEDSRYLSDKFSSDRFRGFYGDRNRGWYWYEDPAEIQDEEDIVDEEGAEQKKAGQKKQEKKGKREKREKEIEAILRSGNATTKMNLIKEEIDRAKNEAILYPTHKNIANYIEVQNRWADHSSYFSQKWQEVILRHPDLNYSLRSPTNASGRKIYIEEKRQAEEKELIRFSKKGGIFYFYKLNCRACQAMTAIIKQLEKEYQITILPISIDDKISPAWPNSKTGSEVQTIIQAFQIKYIPALFAVSPYQNKIIPIAYGVTSLSKLKFNLSKASKEMRGEMTRSETSREEGSS